MTRWLLPLVLFSQFALAAESVDLKSPSGNTIRLDLYSRGFQKALVLAQGQGCSPRLDLYNAIAEEAAKNKIALIRLYWSYCLSDPEHGEPSDGLVREQEELLTAIKYAESSLGITKDHLSIGGKSLGSLVSWPVFRADPQFQALVLLTPVCSDSDKTPHENIFENQYPNLIKETRPVLIAQGHADPICEAQHSLEFLRNSNENFVPLIVRGDHRFNVVRSDGSVDVDRSAANLRTVAHWIFNWLP